MAETPPAPPNDKEFPICRDCGSIDILCDAYAAWDHVGQQWDLHSTYGENAACQSCGAGGHIIEWLKGDPLAYKPSEEKDDDANTPTPG